MEAARTSYELLVETLVSSVSLSTFQVAVTRIPVPRNSVYRLRIDADRDLTEVVRRLTETDVELLGIRRCAEHPRPRRDAEPAGATTSEEARSADGVVVWLRDRRPRRPDGSPLPLG